MSNVLHLAILFLLGIPATLLLINMTCQRMALFLSTVWEEAAILLLQALNFVCQSPVSFMKYKAETLLQLLLLAITLLFQGWRHGIQCLPWMVQTLAIGKGTLFVYRKLVYLATLEFHLTFQQGTWWIIDTS